MFLQVMSLDPLNAIITGEKAFVMVPDGADDLLRRVEQVEAHFPSTPAPQPAEKWRP